MLRCRWGGVGWGGVGWGGMLPFAARCTRCGCYVADGVGWGGVGWGGVGCCRSLQDVRAVDATLPMGWGGVGWDVDVRCKMYTLWMLRCRWGPEANRSVQDASVEGLVNKSELPSLQPV